ncbi:MAG: hypothetical protein FLDDKLPJ_03031 [Phycisphaerae bacterium]|nr:hypothetical protein [Phycisphaerae bacterium]
MALSMAKDAPLEPESHVRWERGANGRGWMGTTQSDVPSPKLFRLAELDEPASRIEVAFFSAFPNYRELYGAATFGWSRLDGRQLLHGLLHDGWNRFRTWDWKPEDLAIVVRDLIDACKQTSVKCWFAAPLLNLRLQTDLERIELIGGMELRALTDEEATSLYGGPSFLLRPPHHPSHPQQAAVFGCFTEDLSQAESKSSSVLYDKVWPELDRIVSTLRILKAGPVGIEGVHAGTKSGHPSIGSIICVARTKEYIPSGTYDLGRADLDQFEQIINWLSGGLHESLRVACGRLSSASLRRDPADRLLDAVIGMESILLREVGKDIYRGEMRYRFAVRYASLAEDVAERHRRFQIARHLYDERSTIVHGSASPESPVRIGDEKLHPVDAANRACEALRELIMSFLPSANRPEFLSSGYWDRRLFGDGAASADEADGA